MYQPNFGLLANESQTCSISSLVVKSSSPIMYQQGVLLLLGLKKNLSFLCIILVRHQYHACQPPLVFNPSLCPCFWGIIIYSPLYSIFLSIFYISKYLSIKIEGVQEKICLSQFSATPPSPTYLLETFKALNAIASVQSLLLAGNFFYNQ